jgi:hypothetical protein
MILTIVMTTSVTTYFDGYYQIISTNHEIMLNLEANH